MKGTLLTAAAMFCTAAQAHPVYLSCALTSKDKPQPTLVEITADEATQQISYSILETGFTEKLPGVFTADKLRFVSAPGRMTEMQYAIYRTTLVISRSLPRMKEVIGTDKAESGTCTIIEAPKARKF